MTPEINLNVSNLTVHYDGKPIYDIVFKKDFSDLLSSMSDLDIENRKLMVVTETNVAPHYLDEVVKVLSTKAKDVKSFTFKAGEASKNLDVVRQLYTSLIENKFERRDMLVALGGGVVGDLTGFTAATYLRGVDFIQIPTTLLSQVDSSIGGKTGVDFDSFKNMVGAFHMPKLVYINTSTLNSLSSREYLSGMGEVVKYGIIRDLPLYNYIMDNVEAIKELNPDVLIPMIYRSCDNKREVVEEDPKEHGIRAYLNYGHTLGHAIEKLSNFNYLHGECVGVGSILAAMIGRELGDLTDDDVKSIKNAFRSFDCPEIKDYDVEEVVKTTKLDKKMSAGKIRFVLCKSIGDAYISHDVTDELMAKVLKEYQGE